MPCNKPKPFSGKFPGKFGKVKKFQTPRGGTLIGAARKLDRMKPKFRMGGY